MFATFPEFLKDQNWQRSQLDLFRSQNNPPISCRFLNIYTHWILFQTYIWICQNIHFYFLNLMTSEFFTFLHFRNSWPLSAQIVMGTDEMRILFCVLHFGILWKSLTFFKVSWKQRFGLALTRLRVFKKVVQIIIVVG